MTQSIADNLKAIHTKIEAAATRAKRPLDAIQLVAVSKGQPIEKLQEAYDAGVRIFGENYIQEWRDKADQLPKDIQWHFIGHLQSNKARFVAEGPCHCLHSLSSLNAARKLDARRHPSQPPLHVLLELDLAGESSKSGIKPENTDELIAFVDSSEHLQLIGLMVIPPFAAFPEDSRPFFKQLRKLRDEINRQRPEAAQLKHLSMGMSGDFEIAIEEGATLVRVGSSIFGPRHYKN